jgi:acyl-CoA synthetase (AMP-forming)/AMP-acid ligase II/FPC/CPF motif-containing protein YcgG/acyl carrier protein
MRVENDAGGDRGNEANNWTTRIILGERVGGVDLPEWLAQSYEVFRRHLTDDAYPCFFGTQAERRGEMFYAYVSGRGLEHLPGTLAKFVALSSSREHERNNLAVFFEPEPKPLDHQEYRAFFWQTLQYLHDHDPDPHAAAEQVDPSHPMWEFTFAGLQMFVVGISPSYQRRRSRNLGAGMMMLFQPRSVFVDAVTNRAIGPEARAEVRRRLLLWDGIPAHPDLGVYGDPENREWTQYFVSDDDVPEQGVCPFTTRRQQAPTANPRAADRRPDRATPEAGGAERAWESAVADTVTLLRHRASRQPDQVAVRFLIDGEYEEENLSYADLDRQARQLAAELHRHANAGDRAMLLLPSGLDYVVSFFACLYAGVIAVPAYPADTTNPQHVLRLRAMLRDCTPRLLLTDEAHRESSENLSRADLPADCQPLAVRRAQVPDGAWRPEPVRAEDIAFLLYTSGSTSSPRGVMVSHANLIANEKAIRSALELESGDVMANWLPLYHDMGLIGGLLAPIFCGFPVVLMSPHHFLERPSRWLKMISRYGATVTGGPDFAYQLCVDRVSDRQLEGVDLSCWRLAWCGAEPIRLRTMESFTSRFAGYGLRPNALYPCYGLAEATLMVSGNRPDAGPLSGRFSADGLARGEAHPDPDGTALMDCGAAQPGHTIRIVDPSSLTECPEGRIGEIWFAGPSVASGYWRYPGATRETFHASLAGSAAERYLRTGDLGFVRDGKLFVSGRLKDLIIIRGQNYYPQDIEWTLSERVGNLRRGRIAAFPVTVSGVEGIGVAAEISRGQLPRLDVDEIFRAINHAVVSAHQEPVSVILLLKPGDLPRTSSGKIRRSACVSGWQDGTLEPVAVFRRDTGEGANALRGPDYVAPRTETERRLADIWAEVFGTRPIGVEDDFFDLGGQSLTATRLLARVSDAYGVELPPRFVFEARTIAAQAQRLGRESPGLPRHRRVTRRRDVAADALPLSPGQEGVWFLWKLEPGSAAYNASRAIRLAGELDVAALRSALTRLVARHESLRTRFAEAEGVPRQVIGTEAVYRWLEEDFSGLTATEREARLRECLRRTAAAPFNLEHGPPLRAALIRLGAREHVLLLATHHIVSDGWSASILVRELIAFYEAARTGQEPALPAQPIRYGDYVLWQREWLDDATAEAQLAYWRKRLGTEHPVLQLPADRVRTGARSPEGGRCTREVSAALTAELRRLSQAQGATLFMTLLAAFDVLLYRYSGQHDVRIGVPVAGRQRLETEGLTGFFVNMLVIRTELSGALPFRALLAQVCERVLEAQAHQDLPFTRLVEALQPDRSLHQTPLFQVTFNLQQAGEHLPASLPQLAVSDVESGTETVQFDLTLHVAEKTEGLQLSFDYARDLFDAATVERLLRHYVEVLAQLAADAGLRPGEIALSADTPPAAGLICVQPGH